MEDFLKIDTPENVAFHYEVAGLPSRSLAALVDSLLILVLQGILLAFFLALARSIASRSSGVADESNGFMWLVAGFILLSFIFLWGYYIFFEWRFNGQSPGKMWLRLRVLRADGLPVSLTEVLIRNLVRAVDFLPAYYGVGLIAVLASPRSQRLGDLAAGTVVVRDVLGALPTGLSVQHSVLTPFTPSASDATAVPVARLSQTEVQVIEDFLARQYVLPGSAQLGERLWARLLERLDLPADWCAGLELRDRLMLLLRQIKENHSLPQ